MIPVPGFLRGKAPRPRSDDSGLRRKAPAAARRAAEKAGEDDGAHSPIEGFKRWLRCVPHREPVPSCTGPVEDPEPGKTGICCSGGGIRSAAFSLGALQLLEQEGQLERASYLAAVSGGSYIAAAISMVAKRQEPGSEPCDSDPELLDEVGPFAPSSPEEQYLRNRSSYLAPTLVEKIYLGWRLVLGLLFNLAFVSMPLIGGALILTGLLYAPALPELAGGCDDPPLGCKPDCGLDLPLLFGGLPLLALALSAALGLVSLLARSHSEERKRGWTIWSTRLLIAAAGLALVLVAVPFLVDLVLSPGEEGSAGSVIDGAAPRLGAGTLALLVGVVTQLGHLFSSKETQEDLGRARKTFDKLGKATRIAVTYAAGGLVGPLLLLAVVVLTIAAAMSEVHGGDFELVLVGLGAAVLVLFLVLYLFVDLTTWSLHPFYKRRLASVFALRRVRRDALDEEEEKRVEALAEGEPGSEKGIAIERDYEKPVPMSETALTEEGTECEWPTLLVCAAANVSDSGATPPGRRVTSFTFSAYSVGGPLVGAVGMKELEDSFQPAARPPDPVRFRERVARRLEKWVQGSRGRRARDLTLPAAMAMSGAAISPSMGKMTKRPLTFLMALANVRLGVWVPSPRRVGDLERGSWQRSFYSRPRPWYLLCELFGINRVGARYLYITDGGHYENLGLVELLRRGCTNVYCLDASGVGEGKGEFEALGDAIALARSELGVEIELDEAIGADPDELVPGEEGVAERDVVVGRIVYPAEPGEKPLTGKLVYVRNTMTAKAPWDVRAYQKADPRFPNNPTIDQLYTDQKFEAYRVLGALAGANAVEAMEHPVPG